MIVNVNAVDDSKSCIGFERQFFGKMDALMNKFGKADKLTMIFTGYLPSNLDVQWASFLSAMGGPPPFSAYSYSKFFDNSLVKNEGAVFVYRSKATNKTIAHELGHILGGLRHPWLSGGLMFPFSRSCEVDDNSLERIYTSPYVQRLF